MAQVDKSITIYEGIGSKSGKPFTAIRVQVGKWDSLMFPQGKLDMDYLKNNLDVYVKPNTKSNPSVESQIDDDKASDFLND